MTEPTSDTPQPPVSQSPNQGRGPDLARSIDMLLVTYVAFLVGLVSAGFGAIVGVVIAYLKRSEVTGTWRESHYTWLIRTFWIGALFGIIGAITTIIFIGVLILFATFIWFVIRLVKGWMAYANEEPVNNPEDWFFG